jgi:uncharacterized protein YjiS (DUF1127 family)
MALADFAAADRSVRLPFTRILGAVVRWVEARRLARAKHDALQSLLFAPEHLLRDVGLTREQLVRAIETQGR